MPISPDQSRFTACAIGEATPQEQASFDAALLSDAALREEAVTLSRTAHRLATAFKQEKTVSLTASQRQHLLLGPPDAMLDPTPKRRSIRRAWVGPTALTAGIAALLAVGLFILPSRHPEAGSPSAQIGIPSVALQTGSSRPPGSRPLPPPPSLPAGSPSSVMPDSSPLASPFNLERKESMAAVPPVIRVIPAPVPSPEGPARDDAARPLPGKITPVESFASPVVQPP